jgi:hypothetical protein
MTEPNFIAKSIVPKSDQLNAEDLISGPITVTVTDVKQGSAEQPIAIIIDGGRQPYKPCKTMRKMLVYCWTDQAANWIGKRMTLYADPGVKWAGVAVGGIRISHISGIEKETTLMLSETKGKRKAYTVGPISEQQPASKAKPKTTHPVVIQWGPKFKTAPPAVLGVCAKIREGAEAKDPQILSDCEPLLAQILDEDWQQKLKDFLKAVLDHANEAV